jgi:hypothetical protein
MSCPCRKRPCSQHCSVAASLQYPPGQHSSKMGCRARRSPDLCNTVGSWGRSRWTGCIVWCSPGCSRQAGRLLRHGSIRLLVMRLRWNDFSVILIPEEGPHPASLRGGGEQLHRACLGIVARANPASPSSVNAKHMLVTLTGRVDPSSLASVIMARTTVEWAN